MPTKAEVKKVGQVKGIFCYECAKEIEKGDEQTHEGDAYCEDCFNENFYMCEGCSESFPQDDAQMFNDAIYCEDCIGDVSVECDACSRRVGNDDIRHIGGDDICDRCYESDYFYCERCDTDYHNDDYGSDGNCSSCADQEDEDEDGEESGINGSSYMPRFVLSKEPWENTLYQGLELEVEIKEGKRPGDVAREFIKFLKANKMEKYIYLKQDGSLNRGFEIVSHPFTSRARHRIMNWYKVLDWLKKNGAVSESNCGLHIHVSREALSRRDIQKLKMFFSGNRVNIGRVAGRRANNYCKFEDFGLPHIKNDSRGMDAMEDRYHAVNVNTGDRKPTVELRIFKSTLDYKRLLGCLQFSEAVCEFVKVHGVMLVASERAWDAFMEWLKGTSRYGHLLKVCDTAGAV